MWDGRVSVSTPARNRCKHMALTTFISVQNAMPYLELMEICQPEGFYRGYIGIIVYR